MSQSAETEALKKDLEQLRRDLKALADAVKQSTQEHAQEHLNSARETFEGARQSASRQAEHLGEEIKARPFTSVLTAFGVGLLLGKLFGR
ncbi:hypothetical protein A6D6_00767 [Alcanivorax xiamenensis]|uniref:Membrane-anchored ribosome-binding protein, inhibits growth in stationary phase, ElaB/YqjD/DUF883 family n=1 Tax=Alcanivorax xiamenensis TaxID=1177156 RepID=A0ABQ6YCB1_9GAMM|nr:MULTISPECIES: DUF883 family protein [Alcanivorax]KAF0807770.1 hypothetical protein A6D6_00767 [Alcanivorax xiamenensis]